ncbi:MAG: hypothetical protein ACK5V2_21150 [Pseudomonadota bacterium]
MARGSVHLDGERLGTGDAAKRAGAALLRLDRGEAAEVLVFDLP